MGELLDGSPAHRPISSAEMTEWGALYQLRAAEHEEQTRKARSRRR